MAALEFMVFVLLPCGLVGCVLLTLWRVGSATHGFMGHVHDLRQYLRWTHGSLTRLERRLAELERRGPAGARPEGGEGKGGSESHARHIAGEQAAPLLTPAEAAGTGVPITRPTPAPAESLPVFHVEED